MNILIADDDSSLLNMVGSHLQSTDHCVVCVGDGNELLEKLKEFRIVKIQKTNTFLHPCKASFIEATVKKDNGKICSKIKS